MKKLTIYAGTIFTGFLFIYFSGSFLLIPYHNCCFRDHSKVFALEPPSLHVQMLFIG